MITIEELPVHPFTGLTAIGLLSSGAPIWPVIGAADEDDKPDDKPDEDIDDPDDKPDDDGQGDDDDEDDKPLGPKGEKALQAEKDRRRSETKRRRELEAELAALRNGSGDDAEKTKRDAEQAATAKANARILRSEIRAAAAGKLSDPKDALKFLDLTQFEVDEDGAVDEAEIAEAIDALIKSKPYLAAQGGKRFQGSGDGGARKGSGRPAQLTEADLQKMSPEQIVKAQNEGRCDDLLGIKR